MQSKKEVIERCNDMGGMTATGALCEFMCAAFKHATLETGSDFLLRWIQTSHQLMTEKQMQHRQQLNFVEQEQVMKMQIADNSKQQLQIELQRMYEDREKRVATEIQELKASASFDFECTKELFLATFEKLCNNEETLVVQKKLIANERELRDVQTAKRHYELLSFSAAAKLELSSFRSSIRWLVNAITAYRHEADQKFNESRETIFRLVEDRQREHDANLLKSASEFEKSLAEKTKEVEVLTENIEGNEACIMTLSSKLASEQSSLTIARQQHENDCWHIAEITKSHQFEKQQVQQLTVEVKSLQDEKMVLQHALNEQIGDSGRLQREAYVMQENFRRLEKEIENLQILNEQQQFDIKHLRLEASKELDSQSRLRSEIDQQKIETETMRLSRDKLK